ERDAAEQSVAVAAGPDEHQGRGAGRQHRRAAWSGWMSLYGLRFALQRETQAKNGFSHRRLHFSACISPNNPILTRRLSQAIPSLRFEVPFLISGGVNVWDQKTASVAFLES